MREMIQERSELIQIEMKRYEYYKKKIEKEKDEKTKKKDEENNEKQRVIAKEVEDAFLEEEKKTIQEERNDQIRTKRLVDKMMTAPPHTVNDEVCQLLANYKGIFCILYSLQKKFRRKCTF